MDGHVVDCQLWVSAFSFKLGEAGLGDLLVEENAKLDGTAIALVLELNGIYV